MAREFAEEAARLPGVRDRTLRRYPSRASPGRFHNVTLK